MMDSRDLDRHSWCGAFSFSQSDFHLPLSVLQLDPADRAVLRVADERDTVQKKTFTKWVNKHLIRHWNAAKVQHYLIEDLFEDLRNGLNLISLLEVLSHQTFPRERGLMRCHRMQNVQTVLNFLHCKGIKLVNIRADEIVDGNPKLTLGLIWTFILHFQVGDVVVTGQVNNSSVQDALLLWCQRMIEGYPEVTVNDFSKSWKDGRAFLAILHRHRPDLIDFGRVRKQSARENLRLAFDIADRVFGVTPLLDPEDVDVPEPDEKSIITYVSSLYDRFPNVPTLEQSLRENERLLKREEYHELAVQLQHWLISAITSMSDRNFPSTLMEMKVVLSEFNRFRAEEVPCQSRIKLKLGTLFEHVQELSIGTSNFIAKDNDLHMDQINRLWTRFAQTQQEKDIAIQAELSRLEKLNRTSDKLLRELQTCSSHLDNIERRLLEDGQKFDAMSTSEAKYFCDSMGHLLSMEQNTIRNVMSDSQTLAESGFHTAQHIQKRANMLHQRAAGLTVKLQKEFLTVVSEKGLAPPMAVVTRSTENISDDTYEQTMLSLRHIQNCIEWISSKQAELDGLSYGSDLNTTSKAVIHFESLYQEISNFRNEVQYCKASKVAESF